VGDVRDVPKNSKLRPSESIMFGNPGIALYTISNVICVRNFLGKLFWRHKKYIS